MDKLIVILGPTATGKTHLAARLADKLNGEIISADSRQIYRGMDIGTGKDLDEYHIGNKTIPVHLLDVLYPAEDYSVYRFQKDFNNSYSQIQKLGKYPILCGGTGLYIESVLLNYQMMDVPQDLNLRKRLEKEPHQALVKKLANLNPELHNTSDLSTKKRTIRAIEIAAANKIKGKGNRENETINRYFVIGINPKREIVKQRITERLKFRLDNGMIEEVENLLTNGLPRERLSYFGLEYKFIGNYLNGELNRNDLFQKLNSAIHQFAKRQMTFFRRMERREIKINWMANADLSAALEIINRSQE